MDDYKHYAQFDRWATVKAAAVCVLLVLALGVAGYLENEVPTPQPSIEQMVAGCDREVAVYFKDRR